MEALQKISASFQDSLIVESESSNEISCVSKKKSRPWKFEFYLNEIKVLVSHPQVEFCHKVRLASANVLFKQLVGRVVPWVASIV